MGGSMPKNLLAIIITLMATSVFAETEWANIGFDADREFYYEYNPASISQVKEYSYKGHRKVWIRSTVINDISQDGLAVGDYRLQLMWVNCSDNTLGLKSIVGYKKTGNVIANYGRNYSYVEMQDAIPGTMGQAFVDSVCS